LFLNPYLLVYTLGLPSVIDTFSEFSSSICHLILMGISLHFSSQSVTFSANIFGTIVGDEVEDFPWEERQSLAPVFDGEQRLLT
jgi:hypothetical protein